MLASTSEKHESFYQKLSDKLKQILKERNITSDKTQNLLIPNSGKSGTNPTKKNLFNPPPKILLNDAIELS